MRIDPNFIYLLMSANDVLEKGLDLVNIRTYRKSQKWQLEQFHSHYGSDDVDLASMWHDLMTTTIPDAKLTTKEKSEKGFKAFMMAHHFLWTYPKNANLFASRFSICERYCRGEPLWRWIAKIAALKAKKIVWDPRLDADNTEIFVLTTDGTDFKMWEKKHPTLPIDRKQCSHKFNHAAVKYEIALSVFEPKCVWISGPHKGAKHDITIFREGLKDKVKDGKKIIVDRGYISNKPDERMLSQPSALDSKELNNFKSRARLRQETFNGRLKYFNALAQTFRHTIPQHGLVLEAVCVIVQYQMDNGRPIFDV
jgi:hypothetical protein